MIWLQSPPWGRWLLAGCIVIVALWVEMRPQPLVEHPFAVVEIDTGETIGSGNIEWRQVPAGLFAPVPADATASHLIHIGEPILASAVGEEENSVPTGWWVIEIEMSPGAERGDRARVVLVDTGTMVEAVVVSGPSDDPLGSRLGAVAVEPDHAAEAAAAAAQGRVAVMIESG